MVSTWKHTLRALALAALVLAPGFWPSVPARAEGERLVLAFYLSLIHISEPTRPY